MRNPMINRLKINESPDLSLIILGNFIFLFLNHIVDKNSDMTKNLPFSGRDFLFPGREGKIYS